MDKSKKWVQNSNPKDVAKSIYSYFNEFDIESVTNAVRDYQKLGTWKSSIKISDKEYEKTLEIFEFSNLISKKYSKNVPMKRLGEESEIGNCLNFLIFKPINSAGNIPTSDKTEYLPPMKLL